MRQHHRGRAFAAAAPLVVSLLATGMRSGEAQQDPASRAVVYLEAQQSPTTGALSGGDGPSAMYAVDAAAAGFDPTAMRNGDGPSVMSDLASDAAAACAGAGTCAEVLQAAVAAGDDPHSFGGVDLVARLQAQYSPATGAYGDGKAFTQSLAVQGLVAAGASVPGAALQFLRANEDSDGGWNYLDEKDNAAGSDTNSTAMVLMALDAAGDHSLDAAALKWLHAQQDADGGFPYQAGFGTDPDSTALVVQAITAAGQSAQSGAWTVGSHSAYAALLAPQDPDGGYTFPGNSGPDAFTTVQVPVALALQPFPVRAAHGDGFSPERESAAALQTLRYLASQLTAGGGLGTGSSDDSTALFVIGTAAAGYDPNTLRSAAGAGVVAHLASDAATDCGGTGTAGPCGRLIQAALAAGRDPHSFGGVDLVARLQAQYSAATGAYGDGEAFTQSLAVQGLVAAAAPVPAGALHFLHTTEDSDGGWNYLDEKDKAAGSDTNSTAMVLMALDAAGDHSLDAAALQWLHAQQDADGGFPYQAGFGTDPDSTALVLQAITGAADDAAALSWARSGVTPLMSLVAQQGSGGGYTYPGNDGPDELTSAQVPVALERAAFPVPFTTRAFYAPGTSLGQMPAAPSPTPTASPSPVPAGVVSNSSGGNGGAQTGPASSGLSPEFSTLPAATPRSAPSAAGAPPATGTSPVSTPAPQQRTPLLATPARPLPLALVYALVALGAAALAGGGSYLAWRRR